jgi:hypothetical protein
MNSSGALQIAHLEAGLLAIDRALAQMLRHGLTQVPDVAFERRSHADARRAHPVRSWIKSGPEAAVDITRLFPVF